MTDTQRMERIAAWFEPKPAVPDDFYTYILDEPARIGDKGVWLLIQRYENGDKPEIVPVDFLHDEAANALLLDAMQDAQDGEIVMALVSYTPVMALVSYTPRSVVIGETIKRCRIRKREEVLAEHEDRKTAVLLAFCKWAGIEVESNV